MAIIGFILLVLIGLYLFISGMLMNLVSSGFSGETTAIGWTISLVGGIILYLAFTQAPFTININLS